MEPMKSCTTKGTKDHEGFWLPDISFVYPGGLGADETLHHQGHGGSRRLLVQFAKSLTTKATKVQEGNI